MQSITSMVIGTYAPDFELPGTDQSVHHLARYLERHRAIGIVFLSNVCPQVQRYLPRLLQLQQELEDQGFTLIGINANDTAVSPEDGLEQMQAFAQTHQFTFPYLRDVTQDVAQTFGASKTPEAFLLDQSGIIRYQGKIDAAEAAADGGQQYLKEAALSILAARPVHISHVPATGSDICWR